MNTARELNAEVLKAFPLPNPEGETDKDSRGRVLLVGGSALSPGAMLLSGTAALRAGAGKLIVATAVPIARQIGLVAPEFGVVALRATGKGEPDCKDEALDSFLDQCDVALVGPGMTEETNARLLASRLLKRSKVPLVLDAAAITGFAGRIDALRASKASLTLTPHAGEMAKLMSMSKEKVQDSPVSVALRAAEQSGGTVILKGATTFIATPDGTVWRHSGGVSGLATAGSGDALAGLLAALIARGLPPNVAALWSVVAHAAAGSKLSRSVGPIGFLARELPDTFPSILQHLSQAP
jgi:ADP-dependent NAD(P)H-hydrate dehydratase